MLLRIVNVIRCCNTIWFEQYALNYFLIPLYELGRYWLPAINILTAGTFLICVILAKQYERSVLALRKKNENSSKAGSMVDGAVTTLITRTNSFEEEI